MSVNEYISAEKIYAAETETDLQMVVIPSGGTVDVQIEVDPSTSPATWSAATTVNEGAPQIFEIGRLGNRVRVIPASAAQVVIR